MNFDNELTYRNKRNGAVVYGGVPPESPDEWEHVYVIPVNDAILAVRPSGVTEAAAPSATRDEVCLCNVGVQECPTHPGRLLSKDERIAFRKAWDDRAAEGGAS